MSNGDGRDTFDPDHDHSDQGGYDATRAAGKKGRPGITSDQLNRAAAKQRRTDPEPVRQERPADQRPAQLEPLTPSRQPDTAQDAAPVTDTTHGEIDPPKRRRWLRRHPWLVVLLVVVVLFAVWDVVARLSPSDQATPDTSGTANTVQAQPVSAQVRAAAVHYKQLSLTSAGSKWCPLTANRASCLESAGAPGLPTEDFTQEPKVTKAQMIPAADGGAGTYAAVEVGYRVEGRSAAQVDLFIVRVADRKVYAEIDAMSSDQAAQQPAVLGQAVLNNPDAVDGAITW